MRILIISLPRTGSTSLMEELGKKYNLKLVPEPFGKFGNGYNLEDNCIVKTIILQGDKDSNFYLEYYKNFDEVILLSRKDLIECSESMAYLNHCMSMGFKHYQEYVYEEPPNYKEMEKWIFNANKELEKLSNLIEIPIKYYEDLFDKNSPKRQRKKRLNNIL